MSCGFAPLNVRTPVPEKTWTEERNHHVQQSFDQPCLSTDNSGRTSDDRRSARGKPAGLRDYAGRAIWNHRFRFGSISLKFWRRKASRWPAWAMWAVFFIPKPSPTSTPLCTRSTRLTAGASLQWAPEARRWKLTAFGSTTTGLYALGGSSTDLTLFSINASTGVATAIGLTGLGSGGAFSLSTNSSTLFFTQGSNSTLYTISTSTGASTSVGPLGGSEQMGAMVFTGGTLYGNDGQPLTNAISTINTSSGAATLGPNVTGAGSTLDGLAPDPLSSSTAAPEPGTWLFLSCGLSALALLRLRVRRTS